MKRIYLSSEIDGDAVRYIANALEIPMANSVDRLALTVKEAEITYGDGKKASIKC